MEEKNTSTSQAIKLILVENLLFSRRFFLSLSLTAGRELYLVIQFDIYNIFWNFISSFNFNS